MKRTKISLLLDPITIKSLPEGTKVLCSRNAPNIKGGECSDAWKKFALHCANGSSHIKGIYFDQS